MTSKDLPPIVTALTYRHKAWIVGSAALGNAKKALLHDIDVVVPFSGWSSAACLIPSNATPNKFGGWKFTDGKYVVDVWPDSLENLFLSNMMLIAWQPLHGIRVKK